MLNSINKKIKVNDIDNHTFIQNLFIKHPWNFDGTWFLHSIATGEPEKIIINKTSYSFYGEVNDSLPDEIEEYQNMGELNSDTRWTCFYQGTSNNYVYYVLERLNTIPNGDTLYCKISWNSFIDAFQDDSLVYLRDLREN